MFELIVVTSSVITGGLLLGALVSSLKLYLGFNEDNAIKVSIAKTNIIKFLVPIPITALPIILNLVSNSI